MRSQNFEEKKAQSDQDRMDHLLMENIGKLAEITEGEKALAKEKKDFAKLFMQKLGRGELNKQSLKAYKLGPQEWVELLKEKLLYGKGASFRWMSAAGLALLFVSIGLELSLFLPSQKELDSLETKKETVQTDKEKSRSSQQALTKTKGASSQDNIKQADLSSSKTSSPHIASRKGKLGKIDSKEEELLLALETAENEMEKEAALKKLKAYYIRKNNKEEAQKIQKELEKLSSSP